jgi:hypothetical protein
VQNFKIIKTIKKENDYKTLEIRVQFFLKFHTVKIIIFLRSTDKSKWRNGTTFEKLSISSFNITCVCAAVFQYHVCNNCQIRLNDCFMT